LRRAIVMVVTQEAYLFSGSVADNIALGKRSGRRRTEIHALPHRRQGSRVHPVASERV
jgi:ABC-type multidrug transport system fused ATPase/permease subunit